MHESRLAYDAHAKRNEYVSGGLGAPSMRRYVYVFIVRLINKHTQRIAGTISVCRDAIAVLSALEN
eukprot:3319944-Pleurochrysis_carterae.AAC.2